MLGIEGFDALQILLKRLGIKVAASGPRQPGGRPCLERLAERRFLHGVHTADIELSDLDLLG